jgi:hypothetical protein
MRPIALLRLAFPSVVAALAGCAGLDVTTLGADAAADRAARGFRYYQSAPFLFVVSDGKGGVNASIRFLPDTTQKMSIRPYAFASSNEATLTFDGGVLTRAATEVDETAVASAALDALAKALAAAARASLAAAEFDADPTAPVPYLFRIVQKDDAIELRGGPLQGAALDPSRTRKMVIRVTLAKAGG